jgi:hypothetical protein
LVLKNVEGAKYPASAEAVEDLSDEDLRRYYRIILDCSNLTEWTARFHGDNPFMADALSTLGSDCLVYLFDLSQSFFQIHLTKRAQALFCFSSQIPDQKWLA